MNKNMEPLLEFNNITISYNGGNVVKNVNFSLHTGDILGIVGESGSGKSTMIKGIIGLLGPSGRIEEGDIRYKGADIVGMAENEKRKLLGPEIGMVFQDCKSALCPVRTVGAQIYEAMRAHGKVSKKEIRIRAREIMQKVGLEDSDRVLNSYPFELSGGMNQRVGICIAMMQKPALLLADEPTSALDVTVQKQVVEELKLLRTEYHTAMVIVTHNIGVVRTLADQVMVLKNGKVMDYGITEQVLNNPKHPYTRKLMASVLRLNRE